MIYFRPRRQAGSLFELLSLSTSVQSDPDIRHMLASSIKPPFTAPYVSEGEFRIA